MHRYSYLLLIVLAALLLPSCIVPPGGGDDDDDAADDDDIPPLEGDFTLTAGGGCSGCTKSGPSPGGATSILLFSLLLGGALRRRGAV
jgi:hypothetical protein